MNKQFVWTHYPSTCVQCLERVDTCNALSLSSLHRVIRDSSKCTHCETCSTICDSISTEFKKIEGG